MVVFEGNSSQLVTKFLTAYETQWFIVLFTVTRDWF